jgi:protein phosphatase
MSTSLIAATDIFCLHEIGNRANNEDCIFPRKGAATLRDTLFIVCDGVGGENKGEVASEIVCTSINDYFQNKLSAGNDEKDFIQKAIRYAIESLITYVATNPMASRMSTTLALVLLGEQSVITAWCGDTRIHHIRNGKVAWKSKDHSLVSELVSQGELTEEEARKHPRRNVITRSLNALNFNNNVDFYELTDVKTDDYILICTDGLLEKVNDEVISNILSNENEKDKAKGFMSYCDGVTKDNFSMYLFKVKNIPKKKIQVLQRDFILFVLLILACIAVFVWVVLLHPS